MICHTISAQVGAIERVIAAVKSGELSQDAIQASVKRVENLKSKFVASSGVPVACPVEASERNAKEAKLATEIYAKSTTIVRSDADVFPISPNTKSIVFVSPGKLVVGGGAVESGEEKTREPHTPATYIDILRTQNANVVNITFVAGSALSTEDESHIEDADVVILATRNASLSSYQKEFGMSLGKKLGRKLVVVATCDPYDFLDETDAIKNYIAIYEPTLPAFKAAVNVVFGVTQAQGILPVGTMAPEHDIRALTKSNEDTSQLWKLWQEIFPTWSMDPERLAHNLREEHGRHFIHENGFVISFFFSLGGKKSGFITAVGVLPEWRGKGLGTALVAKARRALTELGPLGLQWGSVFPRFWPGIPIDLSQASKDFLLHRGTLSLTLDAESNQCVEGSASPTSQQLEISTAISQAK